MEILDMDISITIKCDCGEILEMNDFEVQCPECGRIYFLKIKEAEEFDKVVD